MRPWWLPALFVERTTAVNLYVFAAPLDYSCLLYIPLGAHARSKSESKPVSREKSANIIDLRLGHGFSFFRCFMVETGKEEVLLYV